MQKLTSSAKTMKKQQQRKSKKFENDDDAPNDNVDAMEDEMLDNNLLFEQDAIDEEDAALAPPNKKRKREKGLLLRTKAEMDDSLVSGKYKGQKVSKRALYSDADDDAALENLSRDTLAEMKKLKEMMDQEEPSDEEDSENDDAVADDFNLERQIFEMEQDQKSMVSDMRQKREQEANKAKHVFQQKLFYDHVLKVRIGMQKVLTSANCLPQHDMFDDFVTTNAQVSQDLKQTRNVLYDCLGDLLDIQSLMMKQNTNMQVEQPVDREALEQARTQALENGQDCLQAIGNTIQTSFDGYKQYREDSLERWNRRVRVQAAATKDLKTINMNVMQRVQSSLQDKEKLVERTQQIRFVQPVLGKRTRAERDAHIFDDKDFYQKLLRDLIEDVGVTDSGTGTLGDALAKHARISTHAKADKVALQRELNRKKKQVKFDVEQKLVSFMAPVPKELPSTADALFNNLFGGKTVAATVQ